jgi:hypothetical protein
MSEPKGTGYLIPSERIEGAILVIRGKKVMLSHDLAALYGVSTRTFNQAVKRNAARFPEDFMFQLTWEEAEASRSQTVTLKRGSNIKYRPLAFTEHGAVMAASVLNSPRAVEVSVFVVRAFVRLSRIATDQRQLALRLAELESRVTVHDKALQAVIAQLKQLIQLPAPEPKKRRFGFGPDDNRTGSGSDFIARDRPRRTKARRP